MDSIPTNFENVPEIVPSAQPKKPSRWNEWRQKMVFRWRSWWMRVRYGRKPRVALPRGGRSQWLTLLRSYWWIGALVVLAGLAGVGWWYMGVQQEQKWERATDFYRRADYKSAAPILLELPMPDDAEQLRIYGQTMQATNNYDKAIEAYQKLYDKEKDPFAKLVLGNVYNQQQRYDEAIDAYRDLVNDNPNYIQAYVNLATVYRLQGKNANALEVAKEGLQNNANNVVLAELAVSLTAEAPESEEYKEAIETLRRINPDDPLLQ